MRSTPCRASMRSSSVPTTSRSMEAGRHSPKQATHRGDPHPYPRSGPRGKSSRAACTSSPRSTRCKQGREGWQFIAVVSELKMMLEGAAGRSCGRSIPSTLPAASPSIEPGPPGPTGASAFNQALIRSSPRRATSSGSCAHNCAVEKLERERTAVADRAQVGDHARQVGDALADHHAVLVFLGERIGLGGQVVDVKAGEPLAR